ncbi:acyl-CoA dehydrogenase family protein [Bacillus sp. REN16]|uniref:acyl-CoA dehydrogenase family protein n=1 Tax=Bacillus sp. REN16 TaxID=2887296 RepID=UPI001E3518FB|nr:acyl-CoA dehydrogenase family protein [Bacillus sp. REN16]MCC3357755.1 acyl-CoA dehydrogenase family protein [Bacillus sp. REN16]
MQVLANKQQKKNNFYESDETLHQILKQKLSPAFFQFADQELLKFGERCAGPIDQRAKVTDREGEPRLQRYDEYGEEVSRVIVNEGYLQTVKETYETGIVGYVHKDIPALNQKGNYVYSFAQGYLLSHAEPGFYCPVTLTMATAFLLDHYASDELKQRFLPHVIATGDVELYEGATFLTERQGGSDVGANTLEARWEDGQWRLYGEKYFASNAGMCGVAMVLARKQGAPSGSKGLTLFAVPWHTEDGALNHLRIRRLKDKLGVKAVPSGEVEFEGAIAYVVGDPDNGLYYMLEALNLSRICNAAASLGIMKRTLDEALHYTSGRTAFGYTLTDYPMVKETLSTLKAKWHASLIGLFDLIERYDRVTKGTASKEEQLVVRLLIALLKKETAEHAIHFAHESIELHGGNGFIEDFVLARMLRDAQVLTVWEGPANILAHELIRLSKKNAHQTLLTQLGSTSHPLLKQRVAALQQKFETFVNLPEAIQTLEAKPLMVELTQLFEAVCAVRHGELHGKREQKLAEIYIEQFLEKHSFGEVPLAVKYYSQV